MALRLKLYIDMTGKVYSNKQQATSDERRAKSNEVTTGICVYTITSAYRIKTSVLQQHVTAIGSTTTATLHYKYTIENAPRVHANFVIQMLQVSFPLPTSP
jgi:hypothetical protein